MEESLESRGGIEGLRGVIEVGGLRRGGIEKNGISCARETIKHGAQGTAQCCL